MQKREECKRPESCLVDTNMDAEITTRDENILITYMRPCTQGAYTCVDKFYCVWVPPYAQQFSGIELGSLGLAASTFSTEQSHWQNYLASLYWESTGCILMKDRVCGRQVS